MVALRHFVTGFGFIIFLLHLILRFRDFGSSRTGQLLSCPAGKGASPPWAMGGFFWAQPTIPPGSWEPCLSRWELA